MKRAVVDTHPFASRKQQFTGSRCAGLSIPARAVPRTQVQKAQGDEPAPDLEEQQHWLLKCEAQDYSILDMQQEGTTDWDGTSYGRVSGAARASLRRMKVGDACLFYHASCAQVGCAGVVRVSRTACAEDDLSVSLSFARRFPLVPLRELKQHAGGELSGLALFSQPRLSVQPVSAEHFAFILGLAERKEARA